MQNNETKSDAMTGGVDHERSSTTKSEDEKTADKPHRLTLGLSVGALTLSLVGIAVSGVSVYYNRLGLRVGQRAYLSFKPTFPTYADDANASEQDELSLPASLEIKNLGNTPAYNLELEIEPSNAATEYKFWLQQESIPAIGPKDVVQVSFNIAGSRKIYRSGQSFPASAPQLCFTARYVDVFGSNQSDRSCFGPSFKITMEVYNPPRAKGSPSP